MTQAKSVISAMKSLIDLYSFTDMAANSGPPYNLHVDLRALLGLIENNLKVGSYSNDYDFQVDLMNMMNPLFDAHTLYRGPSGYQCFMVRPFDIEASLNPSTGKMQYTLRQGPLGQVTTQIWANIFNFDASPYLNQVVTNINGMSVTDHLMLIAQNFISTYKDHGVRYNAALRHRWSQTILSMFPLTDSNLDYVSSMTFANGMTVDVPNAGFCGGGINSTQMLLQRNQFTLGFMNAAQKEGAEKNTLLVQGVDVHRENEEMFQQAVRDLDLPIIHPHKRQSAQQVAATRAPQTIKVHDYRRIHQTVGREFHDVKDLFVPTHDLPANFDSSFLTIVAQSQAKDTYFMKYNDGVHPTTWILKLTTFAPGNVQDTLNVIQRLIQDGKNNAGTNLVIDVAYNGGGIICLSDLLLALLVPEWGTLQPTTAPTVPYGIYDYKQSVSALAIRAVPALNQAFTSFQNYLDIGTEKPSNDSFYKPILRTRGGYSSNYTQQGYFPAGCVGYPGGSFKAIPYYFKSITVITDGTCGSACALFASQLQSENLAKIISYGGPSGRTIPLSTASFAGGNVLEYNTVSLMSFLQGNGAPGLPPIMTSSAASRFNFNEYYETISTDVPREFLKRPAQVHLDYYATFYNDDPTTPLGLSNNAALYNAVVSI
jgi:C-terminal processing protease CtpA/Prc